ncbi:MAG: VIT1/CCC1 transporter family protein [Candidatus Sungbacteria bacterium]|nr:VIT1/CCC1 transporter family protein [Candidatus Sungbacteria bacterium]
MAREQNLYSASYLRNFVFGVEDSLVSTVGLLSGVSIAGVGARAILITGIILVFVEAFSMAVGSFLSEHSAEGYLRQTEAPFAFPITSGGIMFVSYFFSGFIPLFPYIFLTPGNALWYSIGLSLAALFVLGIIGAKLSKTNIWKGSLRMASIGGIAIAVGVAIGRVAGAF